MTMKKICVFCASNSGNSPQYLETARKLGKFISDQNADLIYGGATVGLMGAVADGAMQAGGRVFGVLPKSLQGREIAHAKLTKLYIVDSMHERKQMMFDLSDAIIVLPGGLGTLDETFEILTWAQLGLHQRPCGILNINGFYDHLLKHLDVSVSEGLLKAEHRSMLLVSDTIEDLWDQMRNYRAPVTEKWISRVQT